MKTDNVHTTGTTNPTQHNKHSTNNHTYIYGLVFGRKEAFALQCKTDGNGINFSLLPFDARRQRQPKAPGNSVDID